MNEGRNYYETGRTVPLSSSGERFQAMYLCGATRGKQVKVVSVLKEYVPLTYSGFGEE